MGGTSKLQSPCRYKWNQVHPHQNHCWTGKTWPNKYLSVIMQLQSTIHIPLYAIRHPPCIVLCLCSLQYDRDKMDKFVELYIWSSLLNQVNRPALHWLVFSAWEWTGFAHNIFLAILNSILLLWSFSPIVNKKKKVILVTNSLQILKTTIFYTPSHAPTQRTSGYWVFSSYSAWIKTRIGCSQGISVKPKTIVFIPPVSEAITEDLGYIACMLSPQLLLAEPSDNAAVII